MYRRRGGRTCSGRRNGRTSGGRQRDGIGWGNGRGGTDGGHLGSRRGRSIVSNKRNGWRKDLIYDKLVWTRRTRVAAMKLFNKFVRGSGYVGKGNP